MNLDFLPNALANKIVPHIRGAMRYRFVAAIVACIVSVALSFFILTLPSQYGAQTKVFVDTDSVLKPLLHGLTVTEDVMTDVQMMTRALKSQPQLEKLARQTDLDITTHNEADFESLITSLSQRIQISVDRQNVYAISFSDTSRADALKVTNQLLNNFVEDTVGAGQKDSEQAEETLSREISDYERRLTEAEERLKEFKQENVGLMPNDAGDYYEQLQTAMTELVKTEEQLRMVRRRVGAFNSQLEGEEPVFGISMDGPVSGTIRSSFDTKIGALETRLSDLLVEYTDKHPEIIRTENLLKELQEKRAQEIANRPIPVNPSTGSLDLNPIYQSLRIQLNDAEVEAAALTSVVEEKRFKVKELERLVDVVPEVDAKLNRLNRDYSVVNARYQEMLGRWEDLQTSKRVSQTGTVSFRVIEPPFAAIDPVGPPRGLFILAGLIFSIAMGLGVALFLNLMNQVVHTRQQLADHVAFPTLGVVTAIHNQAHTRKTLVRNWVLACVMVSLVGGSIFLSIYAENGARLIASIAG